MVALVALAGCSGAGGGGQPYQTPLNATQVANGHASALRDAGSFSVDLVKRSSAGGQNTTQNISAKADLGTGAYSFTRSGSNVRQTTYVSPNGTAYVRTTINGTTSYSSGRSINSRNATAFIHRMSVLKTAGLNYTSTGTTTIDGNTVYQYVARVDGNKSGQATSNSGNGSRNPTVELDIQSNGLVRRLSISQHTSKRSITETLTYSHVGSTDPTPSWLSEAKGISSNGSASTTAT